MTHEGPRSVRVGGSPGRQFIRHRASIHPRRIGSFRTLVADEAERDAPPRRDPRGYSIEARSPTDPSPRYAVTTAPPSASSPRR